MLEDYDDEVDASADIGSTSYKPVPSEPPGTEETRAGQLPGQIAESASNSNRGSSAAQRSSKHSLSYKGKHSNKSIQIEALDSASEHTNSLADSMAFATPPVGGTLQGDHLNPYTQNSSEHTDIVAVPEERKSLGELRSLSGAMPSSEDLMPEIKRRLALLPFQEAVDHISRLSDESAHRTPFQMITTVYELSQKIEHCISSFWDGITTVD